MRVAWLFAALIPGLAFAADDSGIETSATPVSPFAAATPETKATALPTHPFSGLSAGTLPPSPSMGIMIHERIVVVPDNEDLSPPEKNRWARFEEALGPGASANRRHRTYGWRNNDGSRMECYSPCFINCCVGNGGFSTTGDGFGL